MTVTYRVVEWRTGWKAEKAWWVGPAANELEALTKGKDHLAKNNYVPKALFVLKAGQRFDPKTARAK